ncbi:MAG: histidinol-phosphatase, partial [Verrucomicrobia bacterium]|nr:histidinol-phosphatase [Verrucomicrobiota bacterium]
MPPMKKEQIVEVLETIATLLELQEENPFKIRAYTNAARSIETWGGNLREMAEQDRLQEIPGVGKAIAGKISELALTGSSQFYDDLRAQFPPKILVLFSIPGLGAKKIKALHEKLQINSIADLAQACAAGRVAKLAGFGETTQKKLAETIAHRTQQTGSFSLGAVAPEAERLLSDLRGHPDAALASTAGSYRRRKEIVRDLDFLVATKAPEAIMEFFVGHPLVENVIARGATKTSVRLRSGIQADLRVVSSAEYPFALGYFTGSKEHNIVLRNRALQRGWTLNEYRLAPAQPSGKKKEAPRKIPSIRDEIEFHRALDLDFIPPELRENCGEIEAAESNRLPRLIEPENLRGTFHCHTSASDGRNSLEEMARAAQELGLEYLGIADHSR